MLFDTLTAILNVICTVTLFILFCLMEYRQRQIEKDIGSLYYAVGTLADQEIKRIKEGLKNDRPIK